MLAIFAVRGTSCSCSWPLLPQYYFTDRDAFLTPDITSTNIAINYRYPIGRFEIFGQGEALNLFDEENYTNPNVTVRTWATSSGLLPFNPFTDTPIECAQFRADGTAVPVAQCQTVTPGSHWQKGPTFGQAASSSQLDYQQQRAYRFSVGLRF